ncbi:hypothetical protein [Deefgea piscis]|uniref:hypothetical protein n=1 Tax=Deefgea piscis TaxID=2739061 RepID=UPI001C81B00C|nr:hypothetical protein [Deefgea piscis]QZA80845.1 hypothetical protein K4H25_15345 [Deefgea piscis]
MPNSVAKQIELASLLAQQQMNTLDAQTLADLLEIYQAAVDVIAASIHTAALGSNVVRIEQLGDLRQQIEQHLVRLNAQRQALLNDTLPLAAELGSKPFTPAIELNTLSRINHDAVRFVREFKAADGLQLSDRIWRINRGAREKLINEIELAVVQGHSANQAARAMLARGETPNIIGIDAAHPDKMTRATADILTGQGGSAYHNAARVFRTELNRAHGTAYLNTAEQTPGCIGTRFLLSRAHQKVDICDTHASADLYGLGEGVYPHGRNPWPAHPNTLSYVVAVFDPASYTPEVPTNTMAPMDNRDEITKRYFNQKVVLDSKDNYFLSGRQINAELAAKLTGAPDGSTIEMWLEDDISAHFKIRNALFEAPAEREIQAYDGGYILVLNNYLRIKPEYQSQGIGVRMFAHEVSTAKELGVTQIMLWAAGNSKDTTYNGYYTWARFGFDAELTDADKADLPSELAHNQTIQDLMQTAFGREWWKKNGTGRTMFFDVQEEANWRLLMNYLNDKGVKI